MAFTARLGRLVAHTRGDPTAPPTPHPTPAASDGWLEITGSDTIYRGSEADPSTIYAGFPSLVLFDDDHIACAFTTGASEKSTAKRTVLSRSRDGGVSWEVEGPITTDHAPADIRISRSADGGSVLGLGNYLHKHPDDDTPGDEMTTAGGGRHEMGYTNVQNVWCRSRDEGRTWEGPTVFEPPLIGPSWELCSPILDTGDGRWLAPVSTWPSWHGDKEGDDRWECVAFVSRNEGATWPDFVTLYSGVMEDGTPCDDLIFWCLTPRPPHHICASTVPNWIALRCAGIRCAGRTS